MSDKSKIEWTEATWNPVTGCAKVSQGCKHCYAERDWARLSANPATRYYGRPFTDVQCHDDVLELPIRWTKPRRIFVNSMSDLFHEAVPDAFIDRVFAVMAQAPKHTFQVLTKRPARMRAYLSDEHRLERWMDADIPMTVRHWGDYPLPNVWLGVSVEDQAAADERIPLLLDTPAAVRWISAEPLLGPVDLTDIDWPDTSVVPRSYWCDFDSDDSPPAPAINALTGDRWQRFGEWTDRINGIDLVVVGGESGPKARPMHPQWARALRDQCAAAGVPFLFKQWGEWAPRSECYHTLTSGQAAADIDPSATKWPCIRLTGAGNNGRDLANACDGDDCYMQKVGKKLAGRLLYGGQHDGYPEASSC